MYKRLNITLAEDVLARADAFAATHRYTRSGLIAEALDAFVAREGDGAADGYAVAGDDAGLGGASLAAEAPGLAYAPAPAAPPSLDRVRDLLSAFFAARDDVEAAWVFGSVARGTAGPMSDVDVAVLPATLMDGEARWKLRLDLAGRLPGVLGVSEVDVAVLPDVSVTLGHRALVEGVRVYGVSSRAAAEEEIAAANRFWDFEPVRRQMRARLSERLGRDDAR